jgi:AcrR family transcriptional regulator
VADDRHDGRSVHAPPGTRERRRIKTQSELQAVALRLFERQGYEGTTIDEIASAVDISTRSFFRYFRSKEDLVIWDENYAAFLDALQARPDTESVPQSLRAAASDWARGFAEQDHDQMLARLRLFLSVPTLQGRYWERQEVIAGQIGRWLAGRRGVAPEALPVRVVALAFIAALGAAKEAWARDGAHTDLGAIVDEALSVLGDRLDVPSQDDARAGR